MNPLSFNLAFIISTSIFLIDSKLSIENSQYSCFIIVSVEPNPSSTVLCTYSIYAAISFVGCCKIDKNLVLCIFGFTGLYNLQSLYGDTASFNCCTLSSSVKNFHPAVSINYAIPFHHKGKSTLVPAVIGGNGTMSINFILIIIPHELQYHYQ